MTFNIRFDNPEDGLHEWSRRRHLVVEVIKRTSPHLLALQEGTPKQLQFLIHNLQDYRAAVRWRRKDEDPRIQCPTIFYIKETLKVLEGGEFWLSKTPHVHLSKSWGSAYPRMFTYAKFLHLEVPIRFWFCNTHLDHVSLEARMKGAEIIANWVRGKRLPVILAGDFNDLPGSKVHRVLTDEGANLADTWFKAMGRRDEGPSTVHHFTGKPVGGRVDWILVSPGVKVQNAQVIDLSWGDRYPSDHYPFLTDLVLPLI
jgi:endonuclease/exonuclease/phosphatase family metal-dependent hydrolase